MYEMFLFSFCCRKTRMLQRNAMYLSGVCAISWITLGWCCHVLAKLNGPLEGHHCDIAPGNLEATITESARLCRTACLFNSRCKAISYNTESRVCIRHTVTCLLPRKQVNMIYHGLKPSHHSKFPRLPLITHQT